MKETPDTKDSTTTAVSYIEPTKPQNLITFKCLKNTKRWVVRVKLPDSFKRVKGKPITVTLEQNGKVYTIQDIK